MFTTDSNIVKDYILLINSNEKSLADVPDFKNLREVVENALEESSQPH